MGKSFVGELILRTGKWEVKHFFTTTRSGANYLESTRGEPLSSVIFWDWFILMERLSFTTTM